MGSIRRFLSRSSLVGAIVITVAALFFNVNLASPAVAWIVENASLPSAYARTLGPEDVGIVWRYQNLVLIATVLALLLLSLVTARLKSSSLRK